MYTEENGWLIDQDNNRASIEYFVSREAAEKALASLKNCYDCVNCWGCSDCSRCSYCSDCSGCSRCSRCSYCSDCSGCSHCSRCSRCLRCSRCSYCSDCSDCSDCSGCLRCLRCSRCSYCSDCSDCSGVAATAAELTVPRIENIHQRVYAAVSQPGALCMFDWHTCETAHCRAGWVVTLAGEAGKALEEFFNTELAAMLIYRESGYEINPARFYDSDEAALEDMRKLAEGEAA